LKVGTDAMVLGSFCSFPEAKTALDVGTGTGVLSLMVAQTHPNLVIDALDVDAQNCHLAKYNSENSPFARQINVLHEDIFNFYPNKKYDLIFSNPPFHLDSLKNDTERISTAKHFQNEEIDSFIQKLSELLTDNGKIIMIFSCDGLYELMNSFTNHKLYINEIVSIYGKPKSKKRVVIACSKVSSILLEKDFLIRDIAGNYSKEYIEKTKEFHGKTLD
jgi:tRNA1Val (adenine37-N6)-methyltransferase